MALCDVTQRYFRPDDPLHPYRGTEILNSYQGQKCDCDLEKRNSCNIHYPNGDPVETKLRLLAEKQRRDEMDLQAKLKREQCNTQYFEMLDETSKLDSARLVKIRLFKSKHGRY